jgi:hypothetical protein
MPELLGRFFHTSHCEVYGATICDPRLVIVLPLDVMISMDFHYKFGFIIFTKSIKKHNDERGNKDRELAFSSVFLKHNKRFLLPCSAYMIFSLFLNQLWGLSNCQKHRYTAYHKGKATKLIPTRIYQCPYFMIFVSTLTFHSDCRRECELIEQLQ